MRISDWSSDVCSSDLAAVEDLAQAILEDLQHQRVVVEIAGLDETDLGMGGGDAVGVVVDALDQDAGEQEIGKHDDAAVAELGDMLRSEEHTSELQSLMRTSYAVFCSKKNNNILF